MPPHARAQKKRKTSGGAAAAAQLSEPARAAPSPKPKPAPKPAAAAAAKETSEPIKPSKPANDDDSDKYASAESSSEDEFDEDEDEEGDEFSLDGSGSDSDDSISSLVASQNLQTKKKRKRNDPLAFSTSMSKILGSHLTTAARKDPVLVRAKQTADHVDEGKIEAKARRVLKDEIRKEKEKGRVRDLVPRDDDEAAGKALEKEKVLRSIARSGVAKLYNAVRAAQIKGEEAAKGVRKEGIVGMDNREAKVTEMSKQGFLDLIQASK
ncbi:Rrp15p-domain-containing protein [Tricharina praecox]|uniref:Rrp15p-domain-containing protein n=1 Tax=Tricharina praecox TaxID=43433 RepID=UPI00222075F2|nr:Rrp15p-domain-containing protein [Tricharina praecox]KAI5854383.1 Rrp15p-domain-containing protein [Tricharina praecox]